MKIWKFVVVILILMGGLLVIFHKHKHEGEEISPSALVSISKVKLIPISKILTTYGTVNIAPENIQQITIQNEIIIQQIFVTQGQHVKLNEPLLRIAPTAAASLNLENAKISVDYSRKELDRLKKLRSQFLATNAEVQVAEQNLAKAEASLNLLSHQRQNKSGDIIRAPCSCNIVSINAEPGQVVQPATTLLTYANTNKAQIRLGVEYEDLSKIKVNQKVVIKPIYNLALTYTGFISNITDQIDPKTGLIDVIVPLGNVFGLIPGSMVEGRIYLEPEKNKLVIPRSAVLYKNNHPYVYVDDQGKAQLRWITIGDTDEDRITVMSGLKKDEWVVAVGNYELQPGMQLRVESRS